MSPEIPFLGSLSLDGTDRNADWIKTRGLDVDLNTEAKFREWMGTGVTPEQLRSMALFSDFNRRAYPWLDRLAGLA